ncbi:hypothetical protein DFA_09909 [Cavenderia fasciculata]|uniref:EGF-like domain-containing protein n=1 Tax=Cavenderia fasciculata TaxID=261658 RepID=F4Q8R7_CACFS|nr:uncharacterized protein DFA_09909 [Cavenderia fasciculata]EGG15086.1 hypothetical protein DFA_09909 [Cavenderia fasciculata]|eukprot:XP_004351806.1 hypothetical protein DFA_09909 [Cavenderia fasciculata]
MKVLYFSSSSSSLLFTIVLLLSSSIFQIGNGEIISNKIIPAAQYGTPGCRSTYYIVVKDTYDFFNISSENAASSVLSHQSIRLDQDHYRLTLSLAIQDNSQSPSPQSISLKLFNTNNDPSIITTSFNCLGSPNNPNIINQPMNELNVNNRQQYEYIYKYNVEPIEHPITTCSVDSDNYDNGARCSIDTVSLVLPSTMLVSVLIPPKYADEGTVTNSWMAGTSQVEQDLPPLFNATLPQSILSSSSQYENGLIVLDITGPSSKVFYEMQQQSISDPIVMTTIPVFGNSQEMKYFSYPRLPIIYSLYFIDSNSHFIKNFTITLNPIPIISIGKPELLNITKEFEHYICSFMTSELDDYVEYPISIAGNPLLNIEYPFGYTKYSNQTGKLNYSFDVPSFGLSSTISIKVRNIYTYTVDSNIPSISSKNILININILPATAYTIIVTLNITSQNGLWYIKFNDKVFYADTLQKGDIYQGIYVFEVSLLNEINVELNPTIEIMDLSYQSTILQSCFNLACDSTPNLPFNDLFELDLFNDIKSIEWSNNNIDTSNGPVKVSLFISTTKDNQVFTPILVDQMKTDYYDQQFTQQFQGYFDKKLDKYRIDIVIPQHYYNGTYQFSLQLVSKQIPSSILASLFPSSILLIQSNYLDLIGPYVTKLKAIEKIKTVGVDKESVMIGWNISIESSGLNQFKNGTVYILSDIDKTPYIVQLGLNSLIEIDNIDNNQIHSLLFPIDNASKCRSQTFQISEIILQDESGLISSNQYPFKPFNFIQSDTINNDFTIQLICSNTINDNILPILKDFKMYLPTTLGIDIGSVNSTDRTVYFNLTLEDMESGISSRHLPIIYMISDQGHYQVEKPFSMQVISDSTTFYQYKSIIPIRFGTNGIALSIYGITDNYNNMVGYTSSQLYSMGLPFAINSSLSTASLATPVILTTSFSSGSGKLIARGYGFGDNSTCTISINYGNGYIVDQSPVMVSPILFIIDVGSALTDRIPSFTVKVNVSGIESNQVTVYNMDYQTLVCLGGCSGNGNCTSYGCVCREGWFGPACSAVEMDSKIEFDNDSPTLTLVGPDSTAQVAIVGVREMGEDSDEIIHQYNCAGNWSTTIESSEKLFYSCQLYPSSTTLNVTIEQFSQSETREFAGETIEIPQHSVKYTIQLDYYPFSSSDNTLLVLFNMSINSKSSDVCSTKLEGISPGNQLQWATLYVDSDILYAKFINVGLIDGSSLPISTLLVKGGDGGNNQSPSFISSLVGIEIPNYQSVAIVDPIFQHLQETNPDNYHSFYCTIDNQGLSTSQIGGIMVGIILFCMIVLFSALYFEKFRFLHISKIIKINDQLV